MGRIVQNSAGFVNTGDTCTFRHVQVDRICTVLHTRIMPAVDGPKLKDYREYELDWSLERSAGLLDISKGYLRNIEGGHDEPSRRLIGRFSRVYGLPRECFVKDDDDKEPRGEPTHPRKRKNGSGTGPKRATSEVAA
jgi:hypothetical protein